MTAPAPARVMLGAAAVAGAALLSACGSSAPAPAPPSTVTVTASPNPATNPATGSSSKAAATGTAACATSALSVKLGEGNGAAGSTYVPIEFTNTSGSACTLFGYPGVSFVTGVNGSQVGAAAHRDSTQPAQAITLAPGAVAHATLQVVDAENFPLASCKLTSVHTLKVYPPNQTAPVFISFTTKACASSSVETLNVQTVAAGSGAA
jgi:Protein of unknown function (DUF4232)